MSDAEDAARWRWWKKYMTVRRDAGSKWACWLELSVIPFRSRTESVDELTDELRTRFPDEPKPEEKPVPQEPAI